MIWDLKKKGYSERTLSGYAKRLKVLARNCNIDNPEDVKAFIAVQNWSNTYKEGVVNAYVHYVRMYSLNWVKPVLVVQIYKQHLQLEYTKVNI